MQRYIIGFVILILIGSMSYLFWNSSNSIRTFESEGNNHELINSSSPGIPTISNPIEVSPTLPKADSSIEMADSSNDPENNINSENENSNQVTLHGNSPGNISNGGNIVPIKNEIYYLDNLSLVQEKEGASINTIIDYKTTHKSISNINVMDDWIYYATVNSIEKISLNGKVEQVVLANVRPYYMSLVNDWIYFTDHKNAMNSKVIPLYRVRKDGSQLTKLLDKCSFFTVEKDKIFFNDGKLGEISTDGSNLKYITEDYAIRMLYNEGWLYFTKHINNEETVVELYRIKRDGTGKELLKDHVSLLFNLDNDWLYYGSTVTKDLRRMSLDGTNDEEINKVNPGAIYITDEELFIYNKEEELVRIKKPQ